MSEPMGLFFGHSGPASSKKSSLTTAQRDEIRRRYADGETAPGLALEFGVTNSLIRSLIVPRRPS